MDHDDPDPASPVPPGIRDAVNRLANRLQVDLLNMQEREHGLREDVMATFRTLIAQLQRATGTKKKAE